MANIRKTCLLLLFGFVVVATAEPFFRRLGRLHSFACLFKRCHPYGKCEIQNYTAVCVCPKACPKNLAPVCGTNWKTYNNYCELRRASCASNSRTGLRYFGACKSGSCVHTRWQRLRCPYYSRCQLNFGLPRCVCPQAFCSFRYNPVCGTDGRTYRNICELRKAACKRRRLVRARHMGPCRPNPCARLECCCGASCRVNQTNHAKCQCDFACPLLFDPVCGSDGVTYGSACSLRSAACAQQKPQLRVVSDGVCPTASSSNTTQGPVPTTITPCATVNCGFYQTCQVFNGRARCVCPSLCAGVVKPVCGTDGITYGNVCELQRDSCKRRQFVRVAYEGSCINTTTGPVATTLSPCASVRCGFFARCEERDGSAGCVCPEICPTVEDPVCGSDGVTYDNTCELEKSSCEQQKHITVVKNGTCDVSTTTAPVGANTTMTPILACPPSTKLCGIACDDEECASKGQICCCQGCGNICTTPIKRAGRNVCPPQNTCSDDEECPSGKKCCQDVCSKRCVTPVATIDSITNF